MPLTKLNRNTKPARQAHEQKAARRREELREEIRREVFYVFCTCGRCKRGDYSNLCISKTELAGTLNALKIETARHKVGTWQATSVKNLFRECGSIFDQY